MPRGANQIITEQEKEIDRCEQELNKEKLSMRTREREEESGSARELCSERTCFVLPKNTNCISHEPKYRKTVSLRIFVFFIDYLIRFIVSAQKIVFRVEVLRNR